MRGDISTGIPKAYRYINQYTEAEHWESWKVPIVGVEIS
jgi:hypothetical protein